ncbi:MAG: hypothetical protein ACRC92_11945 [Peptostreptococcaceae bacterium]
MKCKKILIFIYIVLTFICTGCSQNETVTYNNNIQVRGLTLKTSLIQTAYELYNLNNVDPSKYTDSSRDIQKHYKWLNNTYTSMDDNMKSKLDNIFSSFDQWDYLNEVIYLEDNATKDEILNNIINSKTLNLSTLEKEDTISFFDYFYYEYFNSYFIKYENKYNKKANEINKILVDNKVDIITFMENVSGFEFNDNSKSIFYYSFNPFQTQVFKSDNLIISTVQSDIDTQDILSVCFYQYSQYIFDSIADSNEFMIICENLKNDLDFMNEYNKSAKDSYDFNSWCRENLVAGFSKYLDYRYCQSDYQFTSYIYDLDFYNHLRNIGFNPNNMTLKDVSVSFYQNKVDTLLASKN